MTAAESYVEGVGPVGYGPDLEVVAALDRPDGSVSVLLQEVIVDGQ